MALEKKEETKRCKNCDKEISAKAKKCPFCQTDLRGFFRRHPILTFLGILFLLPTVLGGVFSTNKGGQEGSTSKSTPTKDLSQRELVGDIKFSGTQFTITNLEKTDWNSCYFLVNGKYYYPSKTSDWLPGQKLDVIKAGETVAVGFANFTLKDGTRFNAYQTKPQSFTAACENGFGSWGW